MRTLAHTHPRASRPQVNKVQLDIRQGHAQTVDKVLKWFDEEGGVNSTTIADCGCGTGARAHAIVCACACAGWTRGARRPAVRRPAPPGA